MIGITTYERQLLQVFNGVTWDGNLINKMSRDELEKDGRLVRAYGWNAITPKGILYVLEHLTSEIKI